MSTVPMPLLLLIATAVTLSSSPLSADEGSEDRARALFAEGNRRIGAGDYPGALEQFRAAYKLLPSVKILLNIGTMLHQLGRHAEAADAYAHYLSDPAADPKKKTEVEALLHELDAKLARLHIEVSGTALWVRVDDQVVGDAGSGVTIRVKPGTHKVAGERAGAAPVVESVTAAAGEEKVVLLRAPRSTAGAPKEAAKKGRTKAEDSADGGSQRAELQVQPEPGVSHRHQPGGVVRADIDGEGRGFAAVIGASYGLEDSMEISLSGVFARDVGVEPGATVFLARGFLKPMISAAMPLFFVDGTWPGVRGSVGLMWDPSRNVGIFAGAGVVFFPWVPEGVDRVVFVPSVGIQPRF